VDPDVRLHDNTLAGFQYHSRCDQWRFDNKRILGESFPAVMQADRAGFSDADGGTLV
jgi:hypothetical protein